MRNLCGRQFWAISDQIFWYLKKNIVAHHAENMPHLAVKDLGRRPHRFHAHWTLELPAHWGEALPHLVEVVLREDNCVLLFGLKSCVRKSSLIILANGNTRYIRLLLYHLFQSLGNTWGSLPRNLPVRLLLYKFVFPFVIYLHLIRPVKDEYW